MRFHQFARTSGSTEPGVSRACESRPQLVLGLHSPDTVYEVTIMGKTTSTEDQDQDHDQAASVRFRKLPERIRPQDMIATQETDPPPDPTMGRDSERDFMLRNAGF